MKGTTNPARLEQITRLAREFQRLHQDLRRHSRGQARQRAGCAKPAYAQRQHRCATSSTISPATLDEAELQAIEFGAKKVIGQFQTVTALANNFVVNSDQAVAASALARLKFVENSLQAIPSTDEKIVAGLKEARALLEEYRQALAKLIENSKSIDELVTRHGRIPPRRSCKGSSAMKADLLADQQRLESESDATIGETERLIVMLAAGGFLLGGDAGAAAGQGNFAPDDRDVQGDARTRRRQFRRRAARARAQG